MYISPGPLTVGATISEVSIRATDDIGISRVIFTLTDPRGFTVTTFDGSLASGTKRDGVYKSSWATRPTYLAGQYTVYVDVIDEWNKKAGFRILGKIDLNPVSTPSPTPTPPPTAVPTPVNEAMVVTPFISSSKVRNSRLSPVAGLTLVSKQSYTFVASTLFASGKNFGLLSLGHLLEVTSQTPAICSVTGVETWDRGSIYTRATVNTLSTGTCTVLWRFLGAQGRAATSTTMNVAITR
jgi:hypothetical protein